MKNIIGLILAFALPLFAAVTPPPGGPITVREDGVIKGRASDVDFIDSTVTVSGGRATVTPPGAGGVSDATLVTASNALHRKIVITNEFNVVRDIGLDPSGVSDNAALWRSFVITNNRNARFYFPRGLYKFASSMMITNMMDCVFEGVGAGSIYGQSSAQPPGAIILWGGATNGTLTVIDRSGGLRFRNLHFDSPHLAAASNLVVIDQTYAFGTTTTDIVFEHVTMQNQNSTYGIDCHRANLVYISPVSADNCEHIYFEKCNLSASGLNSPFSHSNQMVGIRIGNNFNAKNIHIRDSGCGYATNFIHITRGGVSMSHCLITGVGWAWVNLAASDQMMFEHNRIEQSAHAGSFSGSIVTIRNNGFEDVGSSPTIDITAGPDSTPVIELSGNLFVSSGSITNLGHDDTCSPTIFAINNLFSTNTWNGIGLDRYIGIGGAWLNNKSAAGGTVTNSLPDFVKNNGVSPFAPSWWEWITGGSDVRTDQRYNATNIFQGVLTTDRYDLSTYGGANVSLRVILGGANNATFKKDGFRAGNDSGLDAIYLRYYDAVTSQTNGQIGIKTYPTNNLDVAGSTSLRGTNNFLPDINSNTNDSGAVATVLVNAGGKISVGPLASGGAGGSTNAITNASPTTTTGELLKMVNRTSATNSGLIMGASGNLTSPAGIYANEVGAHAGFYAYAVGDGRSGWLAPTDGLFRLVRYDGGARMMFQFVGGTGNHVGISNSIFGFEFRSADGEHLTNIVANRAEFRGPVTNAAAVNNAGPVTNWNQVVGMSQFAGQASSDSFGSTNQNGNLFTVQSGLVQSNMTLIWPTNTPTGLTRPIVVLSNLIYGASGAATGQMAWIEGSGISPVVTNTLYGSASLDFPSTLAGSFSDLKIDVTGVTSNGCHVSLSKPWQSTSGGGVFDTYNSNDTVYVRFANNNLTLAIDPDPGTFSVLVSRTQ